MARQSKPIDEGDLGLAELNDPGDGDLPAEESPGSEEPVTKPRRAPRKRRKAPPPDAGLPSAEETPGADADGAAKAADPAAMRERLRRDVYGILLAAVATLLLLSLVSYGSGEPEDNWVGYVGFWIGDFALGLLGGAAYLLVPLFATLGASLLLHRRSPGWMQIGGGICLLLLAPVELRLLFRGARLQTVPLYGSIGDLVGGGVMAPLLGTIGASILVTVLMLTALLFLFGDPLEVWWSRLGRVVAFFAGRIKALRPAPASPDEELPGDPAEASPAFAQSALPLRLEAEAAPLTLDEAASPPPGSSRQERRLPDPERPQSAAPRPAGGPEIVESEAMKRRVEFEDALAREGRDDRRAEEETTKAYVLPSTTLLDYEPPQHSGIMKGLLKEKATQLEETFSDFGIRGKVVQINPGPVVTMFEYQPDRGIKLSKIANLSDDISMSLKSRGGIRIVAPIPGKGVVGIEVPNEHRETVYLKEIVLSPDFTDLNSVLSVCLGKDIFGTPTVADLGRMPHVLVAGATGSGKSVGINAFIVSILYKASPEDVKMIMIDPKMLELSVYQGIPHLLTPVVVDMKQASIVLKWAVAEMENRYRLMSKLGVRNIEHYNRTVREMEEKQLAALAGGTPVEDDEEELETFERMPFIVLVIDEFADLMTVAQKEVETSVIRIAQLARAAGIHLVLATQRPSVDVITGLIKANLPTRIAFQVASKIDSRTILDGNGAESLLGMGDMLYLPPGTSKLIRVHGAYVSTEEVRRVVDHVKAQRKPRYDLKLLEEPVQEEALDAEEHDELYEQAREIVAESRQASISYLQRRLKIGYNRSARLIERMEREGIVGPSDGSRPREVYIDRS